MKIEIASLEDAQELVEIYRYYVEKTAITFEYEVPSVEEFKQRMVHVMEKYPYLIAKENDQIVGYAYASCFKNRVASKLNYIQYFNITDPMKQILLKSMTVSKLAIFI